MKVGMWKYLNWTFLSLSPCGRVDSHSWLLCTLSSLAELTRDLFLSHISPTGKRSGAVKFTSACVGDRQTGCLKVIMAFNLSQRWFIWAWLASQTTDLKAWNENYYLGSLISHFEFSECGKEGKGGKMKTGEEDSIYSIYGGSGSIRQRFEGI